MGVESGRSQHAHACNAVLGEVSPDHLCQESCVLIALSDRARGNWMAILPTPRIDCWFLSWKNGPSPMCGGKDHWTSTDLVGRGTWWCNNCRGGGGVDLAMKFTGLPFKN